MGRSIPRHPSFTKREITIIELAMQGLTDRDIAAELEISIHTVVTYWGRMREKYKTKSRTATVTCYLASLYESKLTTLQKENEKLSQRISSFKNGNSSYESDFIAQLQSASLKAVNSEKYDKIEECLTQVEAFLYCANTLAPFNCKGITDSATTLGLNPDEILKGKESLASNIPPEELTEIFGNLSKEDFQPGERVFVVNKINSPQGQIHTLSVARITPDGIANGLVINIQPLIDAGILPSEITVTREKSPQN
ncbi:hypothetical protein CCB80_09720 [Armatimonadetes bacterium Uphvl-Ar1]|nr:hypothetical protein CCB80_09720 [Armatimonadetes bacterium Uphvl-Ar1]